MYSKKSLRFEFVNETSSFYGSDDNTISISEVKSSLSCQSSGNLFGTQISASIYGLSPDRLAELSSKANGLFGEATDRVSMKVFVEDTAIFTGHMTSSIANMNSMPDCALMVVATANADLQNRSSSPFSFKGAAAAPDIINAICNAVGYKASITDLDGVVISNPYYEGSVFDQLHALCRDLNISMSIAPPSISFWPQKAVRDSTVPFISPDYGLIGYPIFSNGGVMFQTEFSTLLTTGRYIDLDTSLPHASGRYKLTSVTHELSSWMPDGPWHSICIANRQS